MKISQNLTFLLLLAFCIQGWSQILFVENFDYTAGDTLANLGWTQIRNGNPITVHESGLEFVSYGLSGIGNAARIYSDGAQEIKRTFEEVSSDSLYLSFLINVKDASSTAAAGGLFLYLTPPDGNIFSRRITVYVRKDEFDNINFGVSKGGGVRFANEDYSLNTTYLLVIKYKFDPDTSDVLSLWINPDISQPESIPDASQLTGTDIPSIAEIILSQLTASNEPPDAIIDGIQISNSWNNIPSTIRTDNLEFADDFILNQNYPNPFNPSTSIQYTIRAHNLMPQQINLSIYNCLGQKIAILVNEKRAAGSYQIEWNASGFPSGVYFYELKTGGSTSCKRMLLVQ